ncbi:hypothetical protein [Plantibacter sp. YIM 135249]|uniref:hypothetical protein n=1 Tax=Plantibacter sp. YIM 135249 TaxID=3423918 RepID=UPI003D352BFB
MAWKLFYGGNEVLKVRDSTQETVTQQIGSILSEGNIGWIKLTNSSTEVRLFISTGTPIYFQYFDENLEAPIANGSPMRIEHDLA